MDAREFGEWIAFNRLAPIGQDRLDYTLAAVAYHVVNAWSSKQIPFERFLLFHDEHGEEFPTQDELTRKLMAWKRGFEKRRKVRDG